MSKVLSLALLFVLSSHITQAKKQAKINDGGVLEIPFNSSKEQVILIIKKTSQSAKIAEEKNRRVVFTGVKIGAICPDSMIFGFTATGKYQSCSIVMEAKESSPKVMRLFNYIVEQLDYKNGQHQISKISWKPPYTSQDTGIYALDALKDGKLKAHIGWLIDDNKNKKIDSQEKVILVELTQFCRIKYSVQQKD